MANGDDNYSMTPGTTGTAACGCYVGPWSGVTLPPRCAAHGGKYGGYNGPALSPFVIPNAIAPADNSAPFAATIERRVGDVRAAIVTELAAARTAKNAALIDVWTLAFETVNHLTVQIAQVRQVKP